MSDGQFIAALAVTIIIGTFLAALLRVGVRTALPDVEPLDWTGTIRRKRDAKRFNEHAKLFATFLNNLGIAVVVTMVLAPAVQRGGAISAAGALWALSFALILHMSGQLSLRLWKSEE